MSSEVEVEVGEAAGAWAAAAPPAFAPFPSRATGTTPPACGPEPSGAAAVACFAPPSSSSPITSPMATVSPVFLITFRSTPAAGAGSDTVAFSLSTSTSGSSTWTGSPSFLSQAPRVASVMDSPSDGTLSWIDMA